MGQQSFHAAKTTRSLRALRATRLKLCRQAISGYFSNKGIERQFDHFYNLHLLHKYITTFLKIIPIH